MSLCAKELCTGCEACLNICPVQCIDFIQDDYGFYYPRIDIDFCVNCGQCTAVCPELSATTKYPAGDTTDVYLACLRDDEEKILLKSSSGGLAYALGASIIEKGGVVFGAIYDDEMIVKHEAFNTITDLQRTQGSKYVQSRMGNIYSNIKHALEDRKLVLFVGTPCQVAGVRNYVGRDNSELLFTCDLLCGGVPSPKLFKMYIEHLNNKYKMKVRGINFRDKKYGFGYLSSIVEMTGQIRILRGVSASYNRTIGAGFIRESCFNCQYSSINRVGDITLGDFFGTTTSEKYKLGKSLLMINSLKGKNYFHEIQDTIVTEQRTIKEAIQGRVSSLGKPRKKPMEYDEFFKSMNLMDWTALSKRFLWGKSLKNDFFDLIHPAVASALRNFYKRLSVLFQRKNTI